MSDMTLDMRPLGRARRESVAEGRVYFALLFPFFLLFAGLGRLLPRGARLPGRRRRARRSLLGEARESANICIGFALMR